MWVVIALIGIWLGRGEAVRSSPIRSAESIVRRYFDLWNQREMVRPLYH